MKEYMFLFTERFAGGIHAKQVHTKDGKYTEIYASPEIDSDDETNKFIDEQKALIKQFGGFRAGVYTGGDKKGTMVIWDVSVTHDLMLPHLKFDVNLAYSSFDPKQIAVTGGGLQSLSPEQKGIVEELVKKYIPYVKKIVSGTYE